MKNIILFGGTFDPIHNGHLRIAQFVENSLDGELIFVLSKNPRFKNPKSDVEDRLNMLELGLKAFDLNKASISRFEIDSDEQNNCTVETLRYYKKLYPNDKLYFVIGCDQVNSFDKWIEPIEISNLAQIVYVLRPGFELDHEVIKRYHMIDSGFYESGAVSSTNIRIFQDLDFPESVLRYIEDHKLYFVDEISKFISEKRLNHSIQVARLAYQIAKANNLDYNKAYVAGLLHDLGKLEKVDSELISKTMRESFPEYIDLPAFSFHQFIGAKLIKEKFLINDEEIIDAVKYHCTGKSNMSPIGMIVYASDKIEPTRGFDSSDLIASCMNDYKQGFLDTLLANKEYLIEHKKDVLNKLTKECFDMYL